MMSRLESKLSFVILKAQFEENEQVDPYVKTLEDRGYNAWLVPTLEFEYHNLDELKNKLKAPQHYSGMVITSPRCAQGIIKSLINCKLDNSWREKPVFVVGEATSRIVIKELNLNPIGADSGNALALIPIILKCNLNKPLLAPCGNLNINILSSNIASVDFENVEVYQTLPHKNLKTNLNIVLNQIKDEIGLVFFSPSGFRAILDLIPNQLLSKIHMFAIGPTTGGAIQEAGYNVSGVCEKPKPESMMNMIDTFMEYTVLPK